MRAPGAAPGRFNPVSAPVRTVGTPIVSRSVVVACAVDKDGNEAIQSLDERIASGEFSDVGSTKERLTRPLRRTLAKDPVGIGEPHKRSTVRAERAR